MRTLVCFTALIFVVPSYGDDNEWLGDARPIVEPIGDEMPSESITDHVREIINLTEQLRRIVQLINRQEQPAAMPMPCECDCDAHLQRIEALEGRMDAAEKQLAALVTVRQSDGTETTSAVEIDTVEGYGDFEVPLGGKVVSIDGVRVRNHFSVPSAPVANTQTYLAAPVEQRTIRIAPVQRAVSVFAGRYYVDSDGCTVDRVTGRKVSCPSR